MPLRPWDSVSYLPLLALKPAEMRALEELPDQTKDRLLPLVPLRPWVGSHRLESSIDRIAVSYGDRPVLVEVGEREVPKARPVFGELEALRNPDDGFDNWCEFIEQNENYIPVAQVGSDPIAERQQIVRLHALGRGLAVRVARDAFGGLGRLAAEIGRLTGGGLDVCFIVDYGAVRNDHLLIAAQTVGLIRTIWEAAPLATVSVSASSFPASFANLPRQLIFERRLFDEVVGQLGRDRLIYSDRGSARADQLGGGSGVIPARIDYPDFEQWTFFRSDEAGFDGYIEQAQALMESALWNGDLRVWGTQMIERTARGDTSAIDTPGKSTAARINLHLQLQTFYDDPGSVADTEDDWED
ncbi:beta family protein [Sphingomonas sp.]|uniref:beta family protein n=1 Tax=Sphingomonas sp. TaxID=28214 RepID=UPI002897A597|nr:beta family protein [Sphingomonas sp.]